MHEWHLTPEYIFSNWTDEKFELMIDMLTRRKEREAAAWSGKKTTTAEKVSDTALFSKMGIKVKGGKHGD